MKVELHYIKVNQDGVCAKMPLWGKGITDRAFDGGDIKIKLNNGIEYKGNIHEIVRLLQFNCDSKTIVKSNAK